MEKYSYDPRVQELMDKVLEEQKVLAPECLDTLMELKGIADEMQDDALLGFSYYYIANTYYALEMDYQRFRENLGNAIKHLALANEYELLTRAYNFVGVDACNNGSYDIAYYYYCMALRTCEDLDSEYLLTIVNANIGQLYTRLGDFEKGRKFIRLGNLNQMGDYNDIYYYHNIINGLVLDGTTSIKLGDVEAAIQADKEIQEMMKGFTGDEGINEVEVSALFFRTQVALLVGDEEEYQRLLGLTLEELKTNSLIFDFMEDIYDFCIFLLDQGRPEPVKQVIEDLSEAVEKSGVTHMMRLLADIEIRYCEAVGDEEGANSILRKIHLLSNEQKKEQNKLYMYSMQLIDTMDEVRRESKRMRAENEILQHQAMTDALTEMPNRLALVMTIDDVFQRAVENETTVGVEMLDIDLFKEYNDTYGHTNGDHCLKETAKVMMRFAERPGIHCARYGGDEFVIIYEDMEEEQIISTARELGDEIAGMQIVFPGSNDVTRITISQGLCIGTPGKDRDPGDFLETADSALYDVKRASGRRKKGISVRMI